MRLQAKEYIQKSLGIDLSLCDEFDDCDLTWDMVTCLMNDYAQSQVEEATSELVEAVEELVKAANPGFLSDGSIGSYYTDKLDKPLGELIKALRNARPQQTIISGLEEHNPPEQ